MKTAADPAGAETRAVAGPAESTTTQRLPALDGFRGLSALFVVFYHLQANDLIASNPFFAHASIFVDVFFVLSGFVIAFSYSSRLDSGMQIFSFMLRRFGRLWPLHVAILAFMLVFRILLGWHALKAGDMASVFRGEHSLGSLAASLVMVQAMGLYDFNPWNGPSWSISVEFYTYLVFALIAYVSRRHLAWAALAVVLACCAVMSYLGFYLATPIALSVLRGLLGFFCGVLSFILYRSSRTALHVISRAAASVMEAFVLAVCFLMVWRLYGPEPATLLLPFWFAVTVWALALRQGALSHVLSSGPLRLLGDLSYAIYMMHIPLLNIYQRAVAAAQAHGAPTYVTPTTLLPLYAAALFGLAALSFRYLEMPCRKAFSRMADRIDGKAARPVAVREARA